MVLEKGLGTVIGKIWYKKKARNRYRKNLVPKKGTGIGTEKRYRYRYRKYLVLEKNIGIGIVQHFGYRHTLLYTHTYMCCLGAKTSMNMISIDDRMDRNTQMALTDHLVGQLTSARNHQSVLYLFLQVKYYHMIISIIRSSY